MRFRNFAHRQAFLLSMSTIYRKTAKGQAEIETRAMRLPPKLRMLLIVVDGKRSVADLAPLVGGDPMPLLETLLAAGVIEPMATRPRA